MNIDHRISKLFFPCNLTFEINNQGVQCNCRPDFQGFQGYLSVSLPREKLQLQGLPGASKTRVNCKDSLTT